MKQIIFLLITLVLSQTKLEVQQYPPITPEGIQFKQPITYSLANYGKIPYGSKTQGVLVKPEPFDGCQPIELGVDQMKLNPFILIERGNCHFTIKSLNAATAGAKLAIIVDDDPMDDIQNIVLGDDGFGDNVPIPTIFISAKDGQQLKQILEDYDQNREITVEADEAVKYLNSFILTIEYQVQKTEKVDVKFFINPPLQQNYELINGFFKHFEVIESAEEKGDLYIDPIYQFYSCKDTQCFAELEKVNCIRGGRYCAYDMDKEKAGTGAQVAEEYLQQICIKKVLGTKSWFRYLTYQRSQCHQINSISECGLAILGLQDNQQNQIKNCMYPTGGKDSDEPLQLLHRQMQTIQKSNSPYFPSVLINNVKYRGSLQGRDVLEDVCATFKNPSSECKRLVQNFAEEVNQDQGGGIDVALIVSVVVAALLVFFLFMIFVYRRMVLKQQNQQVSTEVDSMFSQYIAFHESKGQKGVAVHDDDEA